MDNSPDHLILGKLSSQRPDSFQEKLGLTLRDKTQGLSSSAFRCLISNYSFFGVRKRTNIIYACICSWCDIHFLIWTRMGATHPIIMPTKILTQTLIQRGSLVTGEKKKKKLNYWLTKTHDRICQSTSDRCTRTRLITLVKKPADLAIVHLYVLTSVSFFFFFPIWQLCRNLKEWIRVSQIVASSDTKCN